MSDPIRKVSVPVEPTEAMISAIPVDCRSNREWRNKARGAWEAMLTAAPVREEGGAVDGEVRRLLEGKIERWTDRDYLGDDRLEVDDALDLADAIQAVLTALATRQEAPVDPCASHKAVGIALDPCCPSCEAPAEAGEIDLYDDKVQAGIAWTMRQWGETLGLKTWTMGDGSESVEGDVGAEMHTILVDAGLREPETNEMAALRAQPQVSTAIAQIIAGYRNMDDDGDKDAAIAHLCDLLERAQPQARSGEGK